MTESFESAGHLHQNIKQILPSIDKLAPTPYTTVYQFHQLTLHKYSAVGSPPNPTPIFILPSIINRYFVLDLTEKNSLIRFFTESGYTVYLLDWGEPNTYDRYLARDCYFYDYLDLFVQKALKDCGAKSLHMFGHCLGGTIALTYASRKKTAVQSLNLITTPVDFSKGGLITCWARYASFDIDLMTRAWGNPHWLLLLLTFQMAKPAQNLRKIPLLLKKWNDSEYMENFLAMEIWSNDSVSVPANVFKTLIQELYRENQLYQNKMIVANHLVNLSDIECPVFSYAFSNDHIVPVESSFVLKEFLKPEQITEEEFSGGHIGGLIGRRSIHQMWPKIISHLKQVESTNHRDQLH